jgi:DNA invertase Pin-like site-specific DNA recombinase
MLIGYARVSTHEQNLDLQTDALQKAGCTKIFTDKESGAKDDRSGLREAIEFCREGDALVVYKLDRLARSLRFLIDTINELQKRGVEFKSINEAIDTSTPTGKLTFHIFAALAEFERDIIRQRTRAGVAAAKARGRTGGRPRAFDDDIVEVARNMLKKPGATVKDVAAKLKISRTTLYKYLGRPV